MLCFVCCAITRNIFSLLCYAYLYTACSQHVVLSEKDPIVNPTFFPWHNLLHFCGLFLKTECVIWLWLHPSEKNKVTLQHTHCLKWQETFNCHFNEQRMLWCQWWPLENPDNCIWCYIIENKTKQNLPCINQAEPGVANIRDLAQT